MNLTHATRAWLSAAAIAAHILATAPVYAQAGSWYRGNTHVHTSNSDGNRSPEVVVRWYRDHGYHFVVVTDHNLITPVDRLNSLYGAPQAFAVLSGIEVTDRVGRAPVHLNGLGIRTPVRPQGGASVREAITNDARAINDAGGVAQLNHPNGLFSAPLPVEEVMAASGVALLEVCCADHRGGSGVPSTEELWDAVLSRGQVLYGIAADDAHDFSIESAQPGSAWIMVRASELSNDSVLAALRRGDFYATTGVILESYHAGADSIQIELASPQHGYRVFFIGKDGRVLSRVDAARASYRFRQDDLYVRARIERSDGATAWTQPMFRKRAR